MVVRKITNITFTCWFETGSEATTWGGRQHPAMHGVIYLYKDEERGRMRKQKRFKQSQIQERSSGKSSPPVHLHSEWDKGRIKLLVVKWIFSVASLRVQLWWTLTGNLAASTNSNKLCVVVSNWLTLVQPPPPATARLLLLFLTNNNSSIFLCSSPYTVFSQLEKTLVYIVQEGGSLQGPWRPRKPNWNETVWSTEESCNALLSSLAATITSQELFLHQNNNESWDMLAREGSTYWSRLKEPSKWDGLVAPQPSNAASEGAETLGAAAHSFTRVQSVSCSEDRNTEIGEATEWHVALYQTWNLSTCKNVSWRTKHFSLARMKCLVLFSERKNSACSTYFITFL